MRKRKREGNQGMSLHKINETQKKAARKGQNNYKTHRKTIKIVSVIISNSIKFKWMKLPNQKKEWLTKKTKPTICCI